MSYEPGVSGSESLATARQDAGHSLGRPQGSDELNFVSLGFDGALTLKFEEKVVNTPGNRDLRVIATVFDNKPCSQYPEQIRVLASQDGESWNELGIACQSEWLDLGELEWARYVRLEDVSDAGDFFEGTAADGSSIDGVLGERCEPE